MEFFDIVVATNSECVLNQNLLCSPALTENARLHFKRGFKSAGSAYNAGLEDCKNRFVIFAHQDVYLPEGWFDLLRKQIAKATQLYPKWAIIGTYGISQSDEHIGHVYSNGLSRRLGSPSEDISPAKSIDELLIVLDRESGLRFDEKLPGYHLYGTDICLSANSSNHEALVADIYCIHNSRSIQYLDSTFWDCCKYLRSKWPNDLPIKTPCTQISKDDNYLFAKLRSRLRSLRAKRQNTPHGEPSQISKQYPRRSHQSTKES